MSAPALSGFRRRDRYKLIFDADKLEYVLFDLDLEPGEKGHGIGRERPDLTKELLEIMESFVASQRQRSLFQPADTEPSLEKLEELRSLGYIN